MATVLRHIEAWGGIEHLSRSSLTQRMVMLLAIASARRVSDLCLLRTDVDSLQRTPDKWTFLPAFGAKQEVLITVYPLWFLPGMRGVLTYALLVTHLLI